jgi:arylesterase/paraoxonase
MKAKRLLAGALLLGLFAYGVKAVQTLRPFVDIPPQGGAGCRLLEAPGLIGAEDMEVDRQTGTLWIVAGDRRIERSHRPRNGALFRYRPGSDAAPVRVPVVGLSDELRPHGLGLWRGGDGGPELRLFAVQHGSAQESVEIFAIEASASDPSGSQARHLRSVTSPAFISLNDVAPVGPEAFYATNDHGRRPPLGFLIEDFLFLSNASLVYFDGQSARRVAGGLRYANGVTADRGGRYLVVAETMAERISVFARLPDGGLSPVSQRALGTAPDNFAQDEAGAYWVAAHPAAIQFLRHSGKASVPSASQALRFQLGEQGQIEQVSTPWQDDGRALSASSVAAPLGSTMYVGAVFAPGVLACPR